MMEISLVINDPAWSILQDPKRLVENACRIAADCAEADCRGFEVSVVLSSDAEVARLNQAWRGKAKATNVLSFPVAQPGTVPKDMTMPLGDIVLALGVISREAEEQNKSLKTHFCHLVVHGLLHLLGYDHEDDCAAERMERIEIEAMKALGLPNPYEESVTAG